MFRTIRHPSPATVIALLALFIAMSGTAVAAGVVPVAKRALIADNAKKVQGKTVSQLLAHEQQPAKKALESDKIDGMHAQDVAALPGPASSATGLMVIKTQSAGQVADDGRTHPFSISCDAGQYVQSAGFSADNVVVAFESYPMSASTWSMDLAHMGANPAPANVTLYAVCIK